MLLTSLFGKSAPKECLSYSQEKINNNPKDVTLTSDIAVFYECRNTAKGGNKFKKELATAAITMNESKLTPKVLEYHHRVISESQESLDKFSLFGGFNDSAFRGVNAYSHEANDSYDTDTVGMSSAHSQISLKSHLDPSLPSPSNFSIKDHLVEHSAAASPHHHVNYTNNQYHQNNAYRLDTDIKRISPKLTSHNHHVTIVDLSVEPSQHQHDYAVGHSISSKSASTGYECLYSSKERAAVAASNHLHCPQTLYRENDYINAKVPYSMNMKLISPRAETIESGITLNTFENPMRAAAMKRKTTGPTTNKTIIPPPSPNQVQNIDDDLNDDDDFVSVVTHIPMSSPQVIFFSTLEELKAISLLKRSTTEISKHNNALSCQSPKVIPAAVAIAAESSPVTPLDSNEYEDEDDYMSESEYSSQEYDNNNDYDDEEEEYEDERKDDDDDEEFIQSAHKVLKSSRDQSPSRSNNSTNNNNSNMVYIDSIHQESSDSAVPPEYEAAPRRAHESRSKNTNNHHRHQHNELSEEDEARLRRRRREHRHRQRVNDGDNQEQATPVIGRRHRSRQQPSSNDYNDSRPRRHRRHHSRDYDNDDSRRQHSHSRSHRHRRHASSRTRRGEDDNILNAAPVKLQPGQMYGSDVARQNFTARHRQYAARQKHQGTNAMTNGVFETAGDRVVVESIYNHGSSKSGRAYHSRSSRGSRNDPGNVFESLIVGLFQSPVNSSSSSGKSHRSERSRGQSSKSHRDGSGRNYNSEKYNCEFNTDASSASSSSRKRNSDRPDMNNSGSSSIGSSSKSCVSLPSIKEDHDEE